MKMITLILKNFNRRCLLIMVLMLAAVNLSAVSTSFAKKATNKFDSQQAARLVDKIERQLQRGKFTAEELAALYEQVTNMANQAKQCITAAGANLGTVNLSLTAIGAPLPGESREITRQRQALTRDKTNYEKQAAECRLAPAGRGSGN